jgi:hypothetical protein
VLIIHIISTDEDPGLRIESFAVINLRGVSTNKTIKYSIINNIILIIMFYYNILLLIIFYYNSIINIIINIIINA